MPAPFWDAAVLAKGTAMAFHVAFSPVIFSLEMLDLNVCASSCGLLRGCSLAGRRLDPSLL